MAKYGSVASEPEHPDFEKGEGGEQRGQKIDFNMGETYYLKEDGSKWRRKLLLAMPTIVIFILLMGGFAFFFFHEIVTPPGTEGRSGVTLFAGKFRDTLVARKIWGRY